MKDRFINRVMVKIGVFEIFKIKCIKTWQISNFSIINIPEFVAFNC